MPRSKFGKKKDKVQIDTDWLLGNKSPSKPLWTIAYIRIVASLCVVGGAVWSWPHASNLWLQWDWRSQLSNSSARSYEDVLPILIALHDLNPDQTEPIVQQLASADSEVRFAAYRLLQEQIERWKTAAPEASQLSSLVAALQRLNCTTAEPLLLRSQLATHLSPLIDKLDTENKSLQGPIQQMIADGERKPSSLPTDAPVQAASVLSTDSGSESSTNAISVSRPVIPVTKMRIADSETPSAITPTESPTLATLSTNDATPDRISPILAQQRPSRVLVKSTESIEPFQKTAPTLPSIGISQSPTPSRIQNVPSQVVTAAPLMKIAEGTSAKEQPDPPPPAIRGIQNVPFEHLLNLLISTQSKLVHEASEELMRRGVNASQLDCLLDLAHGTVERRVSLMESIIRDPNLDPVPILTWMAEQSDPRVRRKAIALLGALSNQDAIRNLRNLKQREPDGAIADQISQVLLAAGSASNSRR